MRYVYLGKSGVQVSRVALGTATFGVSPDEAEAERVVGHATDLGINIFDSSNSYGNQRRFDRPNAPLAAERKSAEEILGRALQGRRHDVLVCTKVMEPVGFGPNDQGLSRKHIMMQVEESLRRLQTDYIDIYHAHHPDPNTPIETTLRTFDDLISQGKIRYYGLSTFPAWQIVEAKLTADRFNFESPVCLQTGYNLINREPERDVLPVCNKYGLSVTIAGPLAGGILAGTSVLERSTTGGQRFGGTGYSERQIELARRVETLAQEADVSPAHLSLTWLLTRRPVASVIVGPETVAELEQSAVVGDLELDDDLLQRVDQIGKPAFAERVRRAEDRV